MPRLRLLGGPAEDYPGIVIESRADELRREAMEAQAAWFKTPSPAAQERYAYRLCAWARETHNREALRHAHKLLGWN